MAYFNFTFTDGTYSCSLALFAEFHAATSDRMRAVGSSIGAMPVAHTKCFSLAGGGSTAIGWATLQQSIYSARNGYYRHKTDDGTPIDWTGHRLVETYAYRVTAASAADNVTPWPTSLTVSSPGNANNFPLVRTETAVFPPPHGFRRTYRRWITNTTNPGSLGQRARLEASANTTTTPLALRPFSGQTYEHDGTTWVLSTDPTAEGDIVEAVGLAQANDIVTTTFAEDLQDAILWLRHAKVNLVPNPIFKERHGGTTPTATERTDAEEAWADPSKTNQLGAYPIGAVAASRKSIVTAQYIHALVRVLIRYSIPVPANFPCNATARAMFSTTASITFNRAERTGVYVFDNNGWDLAAGVPADGTGLLLQVAAQSVGPGSTSVDVGWLGNGGSDTMGGSPPAWGSMPGLGETSDRGFEWSVPVGTNPALSAINGEFAWFECQFAHNETTPAG